MRNFLIGALYALASAFVAILLPMTTVGPIRQTSWWDAFMGSAGSSGLRGKCADFKRGDSGVADLAAADDRVDHLDVRQVASHYSDRKAAIAAAGIVVLLAIVPGDLVSTTCLKYVPTYLSILLSIY